MPWKKDEEGNLAVDESGFPVRVDSEGKESPVNHEGIDYLQKTVSESMNRKKRVQELEKQIQQFEGIEDPEKAREALNTVQNLEDKKLIDAGKAEEMKKQIQDQYEKKISEKDQELSRLSSQLRKHTVNSGLTKALAENSITDPDVQDLVVSKFSNQVEIQEDNSGNPVPVMENSYGIKVSLNEFVQDWATNGKGKKFVDPSTGSGARGADGAPAHGVKSRKDLKNAKDKAKYISQHGREAYEKLPE